MLTTLLVDNLERVALVARGQVDVGREFAAGLVQRALEDNRFAGMGILRRHAPLINIPPIVVVTRREDVNEVLDDCATFALPYRRKLTGPFLLGLAGATLERHRQELTAVLPTSDLPYLAKLAAQEADRRVRQGLAEGTLDVGRDLVHPVLDAVVLTYLGVSARTHAQLLRWSRELFQNIFLNPTDIASVCGRADRSAAEMTARVEQLIARRHDQLDRGEQPIDDLLGRLIARQRNSEVNAFDDREIRDNLIGLAIGWLWHGAKAGITTVDYLLDHPEQLVEARAAAQQRDPEPLRRMLWEVLRFRPIQPFVLRTATRDAVIAAGSQHARRIRFGATVVVGTHSGMWDERVVPDPGSFDPTRAQGQYLIFGGGSHRCLGEAIVRAQLPALLAPLLRLDGLRRANGSAGQLRWVGPSPDGLRVMLGR